MSYFGEPQWGRHPVHRLRLLARQIRQIPRRQSLIAAGSLALVVAILFGLLALATQLPSRPSRRATGSPTRPETASVPAPTGEGNAGSTAATSELPAPRFAPRNPLPCPKSPEDPRLPKGTGCLTAVVADLDGDGAQDLVLLFADLDPAGIPQQWRTRGILATGATIDGTVGPLLGREYYYPVALRPAADADGDGGEEVFADTGGDNNQAYQVVFTLKGRELVRAEIAGGPDREHPCGTLEECPHPERPPARAGTQPLELHLSRSLAAGLGYECRDTNADGRPELVLLVIRADPADETRYIWFEDVYQWRGKTLHFVRTLEGGATGSALGGNLPAGFNRFWGGARCGGFRLPNVGEPFDLPGMARPGWS